LLETIRDAAQNVGIEKIDDPNTGDNAGSSYFQVTQKRGRRWSAARAFLKPVLDRANLQVLTRAVARRVVFEGARAVGVEFEQNGQVFVAKARGEVVLAAGAVVSPKLLELSGVGDGERLKSLGVNVVHHSPGVGENLQDHPQLRPAFKVQGVRTLNTDYYNLFRRAWMGVDYALFRRGPLTMAPSQLGAFAKSAPHYATANVQYHFQPLSVEVLGEPLDRFAAFTASICNLRPTSRGQVHAASPDVHDAPLIDPNFLGSEEDMQVATDSLRLTRRIVAQPALARYQPLEFRPGPELTTEADLRRAAAQMCATIFHPAGAAAMGADGDAMAVLDERMRVRGVERLRVIDTSAMPRLVSGNTNAPTIMMAEKGAAMIIEDARL
jgi:choline dehydrogenase-like flavoprotein